MIDTMEAGGGSYPNPPEPKLNYYTFTCDCIVKARISISAENLEQAEEYIKNGDYEECEYDEPVIEEILSYEIEDR